MRFILVLMTAILALAGLVIGGAHVIGGLAGYAKFAGNGDLGNIVDASGYLYHDSVSRFLGGIFFTVGLGFVYCLFNLEFKVQLFRFLLLCIFVGGVGRVVGWLYLGFAEATIAATAIELIFPPVMLLLERKAHANRTKTS